MRVGSPTSDKYLVNFIQGLTHRHLFFIAWFLLAAIFVVMMVSYYRKTLRRNFRAPSSPVKTARSTAVVPKNTSGSLQKK